MVGVEVGRKWTYEDWWSDKSIAVKFAKQYYAQTGHDVVVRFTKDTPTSLGKWVIEDMALKKRGLEPRLVAVESYDDKPYGFVIWTKRLFKYKRLFESKIGNSNRKLKRVL